MDFRLTSAVTATVYNAIGVGKENATSRRELCRVTGLPDRAVRKAIEILRYDRPILTADNGMGYYIPPVQIHRDGGKRFDGLKRRIEDAEA